MNGKLVVAALALALAGAPPAEAHHSAAMFDQQKTTTLVGTVKQFLWSNPHCFIQLMVKNDQGRWEREETPLVARFRRFLAEAQAS